MRRIVWMVVLLSSAACGGPGNAESRGTSATGAAATGTAATGAMATGTTGAQSVEPGPGEGDPELPSETPAEGQSATNAADSPAPAASAAAGSAFGVSEQEARPICDLQMDADVQFARCEFIAGGHPLPAGARVDVLEFEFTEMATVRSAMLVIRSPEERDYPTTFAIAEAREEPGMEESYSLGTLQIDGTRITLPVEFVSTTYPNTGDPDLPTGAIEERASFVVRCDAVNGVYDCERQPSAP